MTSQITFYLSQIIGSRIYNTNDKKIGKVMDVLVNASQAGILQDEALRPIIVGLKTKINGNICYLDF